VARRDPIDGRRDAWDLGGSGAPVVDRHSEPLALDRVAGNVGQLVA
jgi:hypothetical protein